MGLKIFKGIIYPKYTKSERNTYLIGLITEKDNGLIIYNKIEEYFNYWWQGANYPIGKCAVYAECNK